MPLQLTVASDGVKSIGTMQCFLLTITSIDRGFVWLVAGLQFCGAPDDVFAFGASDSNPGNDCAGIDSLFTDAFWIRFSLSSTS